MGRDVRPPRVKSRAIDLGSAFCHVASTKRRGHVIPTNPGEVTQVVVSIHVGSSNPILPIIKVEEAIDNASGTLTETIFGGQVSIRLELPNGKELHKLKDGEFVYVRGLRNGAPFSINTPLTTDKASKPWAFSRTSGSTGP